VLKPWKRLRSRQVADCVIYRVRGDLAVHPVSGLEREFFVVEPGDWVNVIATTTSGQVVLVEQYRHGTRKITLEIPGGMIDSGEDPLVAGLRELREETGYGGEGEILGWCEPNPAMQTNRCWFVRVRVAVQLGEPDLDAGEDIRVLLEPRSRVTDLIEDGTINHALVVAAFHRLALAERREAGA
jgi:ADP-ribose pyrophosphatase